jgi:hypothetical protein
MNDEVMLSKEPFFFKANAGMPLYQIHQETVFPQVQLSCQGKRKPSPSAQTILMTFSAAKSESGSLVSRWDATKPSQG